MGMVHSTMVRWIIYGAGVCLSDQVVDKKYVIVIMLLN